MNGIEAAFAPVEAHNRAEVMAETWGHLAPRRNKKYRGRVVYAMSCYGHGSCNPTILVAEFGDLPDSPWFYDALRDFVDEISWKPEKAYPRRKGFCEIGCVYEWIGTFRNYEFSGTLRLLLDTNKTE